MKKAKTKKTEKQEPYHLLMYVEDSSPKLKRFKTTDELGRFVDDFNKRYPDYASIDSGYWIDFAVTYVLGDVHFFTDGLEIE
jgi:hypothetical protein